MKPFLVIVLLSLSMAALINAETAHAQQFGARETLVIVQPVQFEQEKNRVEAVGTAEAARSITIYPAVGDRVVAVHFQPGQVVKEGELLIELDARRQQVAVEQAEINLRDAQRTVERLRSSLKRGAVPQSELDNAILLRDLAQVELENAAIELDDRFIRAPFEGVIGITDVEAGDRIDQQTAIATLDDRSWLLIDFKIPEAAVSLLGTGAELTVQPWRYSGQPVTAEIVELDSRINPQTRMYRARARIDNENDGFLPGTSFRTSISLAGQEFASIPEAALSWGVNSPFVWVVEGKTAKRIEVQIEQRLAGRVLVSGAIQRDDLLIVEGVQSLREGQPIKFERTTLDDGGDLSE